MAREGNIRSDPKREESESFRTVLQLCERGRASTRAHLVTPLARVLRGPSAVRRRVFLYQPTAGRLQFSAISITSWSRAPSSGGSWI